MTTLYWCNIDNVSNRENEKEKNKKFSIKDRKYVNINGRKKLLLIN